MPKLTYASKFYHIFALTSFAICIGGSFQTVAQNNEEVVIEEVEELAPASLCSDYIFSSLEQLEKKWTEGETLRILHVYAFSQRKYAKRPFPDYSILRELPWERLTITNKDGSQGLVSDPSIADPKPEDTLENIEARTMDACRKKVNADFNMEEQMNNLLREADDKFELFSEGEKISFTMHKGSGPTTHLENVIFIKLGSDRIQLNTGFINRSDLDRDTEARFDPILNAKLKSEYIKEGTARLQRDLDAQVETEFRRQLPIAFKEAGWIPNILDKAEDANWTNIRKNKWTKLSVLVKKYQKLKLQHDIETMLFSMVKKKMNSENLKPEERKLQNSSSQKLDDIPVSTKPVRFGQKTYILCNFTKRDREEGLEAFFAIPDNNMEPKFRLVIWVTPETYNENTKALAK